MLRPYTPERVLICSHHLIIHAKVASTSLRGCGNCVPPTDAWDKPTVALIRDPLKRWVSGYTMYLADLARHSTGHIIFQPPHHFVYDVHTAQQAYKIRKDTYLVPFEEIELYADRCGFNLPHLHFTPHLLRLCKAELIEWLKENSDFKNALKHHLRFDYQLYNSCQSVQSLPANLFIR